MKKHKNLIPLLLTATLSFGGNTLTETQASPLNTLTTINPTISSGLRGIFFINLKWAFPRLIGNGYANEQANEILNDYGQ